MLIKKQLTESIAVYQVETVRSTEFELVRIWWSRGLRLLLELSHN